MTIQEQIKELKTKLEQQNKEMLNKIAELEKQAKAEEKQSKVWKPIEGEAYFSLTENGYADNVEWDNLVYDRSVYERGLCFKSKKEAEWADQHRIVATELKNFVAENDPRPITEEDLENETIAKHYIVYNNVAGVIRIYTVSSYLIANQVYASNEKVLEKAIKHIGEERLKKYYFGVKK